jgi:hypothetical protein
MRVRSWMAALALIVGTSIGVGLAIPAASATKEPVQGLATQVEASKGSSRVETTKPKPTDEPIKSILLRVEIAGLGREGCDVEVAPGNPSCKFSVANLKSEGDKLVRGKDGVQHVSSVGHAAVELRNVEIRGADRTCTVKITVRESGLPAKVVYRGFRIPAQNQTAESAASGQSLSFTCMLSAASKLANIDQTRARK